MLQSKIEDIIDRLNLIKYLIKFKEYDQIKTHLDNLKKINNDSELDSINSLIQLKKNEDLLNKLDQVIQKYTSLSSILKNDKLDDKNYELEPTNKFINLIPTKQNKKWGFKNEYNEIVIECNYDSAYSFNNERAVVKKENKYGAIDINGNLCSNFDYDNMMTFSEGFAQVMKYTSDRKAKWGFINTHGEEVIKPVYQNVKNYSEGLAMVELDDKIGFINTDGKIVIDFRFYSSSEYDFEFKYHNEANVFKEGRCKVFMDKYDKEGIIDLNGNIITSYIDYDAIRSFSEGLAAVAKKEKDTNEENERSLKWGFVDKNGNEVINCKFNYVGSFKEGFAPVSLDSGWGYINKRGLIVIPCEYDAARPFSEGLAAVYKEMPKIDENKTHKNYKWGFIDFNGKVIIPFIHDGYFSIYSNIPYLDSFENGVITVKKGWDIFGKIDKAGEIVEEFRKYNYSTGEYEPV